LNVKKRRGDHKVGDSKSLCPVDNKLRNDHKIQENKIEILQNLSLNK